MKNPIDQSINNALHKLLPVGIAVVMVLAMAATAVQAGDGDETVVAAFGKKGVVVTVEVEFGDGLLIRGREPVFDLDAGAMMSLVPGGGGAGILGADSDDSLEFDEEGFGTLGGDGAEPPGNSEGTGITSTSDQAFYAELGRDSQGRVTVRVLRWHDGELHEIATGTLD